MKGSDRLVVLNFFLFFILVLGAEEFHDAAAGEGVGVAAQGEAEGESGEVLLVLREVAHMCDGIEQGLIEGVLEGLVEVLWVDGLDGAGEESFHIANGKDLFNGGDDGEEGEVFAAIFFTLGARDETVFDIVIHHSGGQGITPAKADELAAQVGDHLVHIQRDVRQAIPIHRAVVRKLAFQFGQQLCLFILLQEFRLLRGRYSIKGLESHFRYYITN